MTTQRPSLKRHRADTQAARTAQARRDNTIRVQEQLKQVIPEWCLEMDEEERRGLDPRARAMIAAKKYIEELVKKEKGRQTDSRSELEPDTEIDSPHKGGAEMSREREDVQMEKTQAVGEKCERCQGSGKVAGIGFPPQGSPYLPDRQPNHKSIRTLRVLAASLVRVSQAKERDYGDCVGGVVVGKLNAINDVLVRAIQEMET